MQFPQWRLRPCDLRALYRSDGFLIEELFWSLEHFCLAWLWVSCVNLDKTFNHCAAVVLCKPCRAVSSSPGAGKSWEFQDCSKGGVFWILLKVPDRNMRNLLVRGGDGGTQCDGSCSWGTSLISAAILNKEGAGLDSVLHLTSPSASSLSNPHCYGIFALIFSILKWEKN